MSESAPRRLAGRASTLAAACALALAALLAASCAQPTRSDRAPGPPDLAPPRYAWPLSAEQVHTRRGALTELRARLTQQAAVDSPERSDVMLGLLTFPAPNTYLLQARAPIGMELFTVGFDGRAFHARLAPALQGRFPAEALARQVARIYLARCGDGTPRYTDFRATVERGRGVYTLACDLPDGAHVVERLSGETLQLIERRVTEPTGEQVTIQYKQWEWWGPTPTWHPRRILMSSGDFRVEILLSDYGLDPYASAEPPRP